MIISHGGATGPPERFVTLTLAPTDWQQLRMKLRRMSHRMRNLGFRWEIAWTVEPNKRAGMLHVHALQKGDYVPKKLLDDLWGAHTWISAVGDAGQKAAYGLKEAQRVTGYALKETDGGGGLQGHLERNGGRLVHLSRGYLGGMTQDEAWQAVREELSPDGGEWIRVGGWRP